MQGLVVFLLLFVCACVCHANDIIEKASETLASFTPPKRGQLTKAGKLLLKRFETEPTDVPSYPYTLTYVANGPIFTPLFEDDTFMMVQSMLGRSLADVISEGRRAAEYFKKMFAVDFIDEPAEAFHTGTTQNDDGVVFTRFILDPRTFYRLVSATDPEISTRFNNFITDSGWLIQFTKEYQSTGSYKGVIPAGAFAVFGNYAINIDGTPFDDEEEGEDEDEDESGVERKLLNIHLESPVPILPQDEDTGVMTIDLDVDNFYLGSGKARGVIMPLAGKRNLYAGSTVLTFPDIIDHKANARN